MAEWFKLALLASLLYGLHQVFTKLAADKIGEGLGALVVEGIATLTIALYLVSLFGFGRWSLKWSVAGIVYSALTGVCVGIGTIAFFLLFKKGAPLSAVPGILAGGMALMAIVGIAVFREPASLGRLLGIGLSLAGLALLRR